MRALKFKNTKTDPRWSSLAFHETWPNGFGYETDRHYLYMCGGAADFFQLTTGTATLAQGKADGVVLRQWLEEQFGAEQFAEMQRDVGTVVAGAWRPGLYYQDETLKALGGSEAELRSAEQALRLLVERLDELLLYVEPSANGLASYSHKSRELLILACTEVENQLKQYLVLAAYQSQGNLTTADYVKLAPLLRLREYVVRLRTYHGLDPLAPFRDWDAARPTQSLAWYEAYNNTKHDRARYFSVATLANSLSAVAANVVLFCARWGPYFLTEGGGTVSSLINQIIKIELVDPDVTSFYLPKVVLPDDARTDFMVFDRRSHVAPWETLPLTL